MAFTDVSASGQTGYLPWVLSTLCSVCSVQQPGASLCLWHSCETLQKVLRYTCFVPCVGQGPVAQDAAAAEMWGGDAQWATRDGRKVFSA